MSEPSPQIAEATKPTKKKSEEGSLLPPRPSLSHAGCSEWGGLEAPGLLGGRRLYLGGSVLSSAMCLQTADQLLARADAAKALAEEAAEKGRNTLKEANDILNNLKGMSGEAAG